MRGNGEGRKPGGWQRRIGGGGPTEGEFRPAKAHLDRLGLSKGGRGIPLLSPALPSVAVLNLPVVLSSFVLLLHPPPSPTAHSSLSKAPNASGARVHVYVTLPRAYMWHGEGLLWRPTLGTGVKRHWPARGLDRTYLPYVCVNGCVRACAHVHVYARVRFPSPLSTLICSHPSTILSGDNIALGAELSCRWPFAFCNHHLKCIVPLLISISRSK